MMEPKYERARLLAEAVAVAAALLDEPIDRLTISGGRIAVSAGLKSIALSYAYHNAYGPDGAIKPGSGHWGVSVIDAPKQGRAAAFLRSLFR